jgi:hypothetical protein
MKQFWIMTQLILPISIMTLNTIIYLHKSKSFPLPFQSRIEECKPIFLCIHNMMILNDAYSNVKPHLKFELLIRPTLHSIHLQGHFQHHKTVLGSIQKWTWESYQESSGYAFSVVEHMEEW